MKKIKKPVIAIAVLIIAALFCVLLFLRVAKSTTVTDAFYLGRNGLVSADSKWTLQYDRENGTTITETGENLTELGSPVYINDGKGILLPDRYVMQFSAGDKHIYKVEYFAEISKDTAGVHIKDVTGGITVDSGLLYDGKDTYILLEDAILTVDGSTYSIPALSTVRATYANAMSIYIYGYGPEFILLGVDSKAEIAFGNRILYPLNDKVKLANQGWQLMYHSADNFNTIDKWKE